MTLPGANSGVSDRSDARRVHGLHPDYGARTRCGLEMLDNPSLHLACQGDLEEITLACGNCLRSLRAELRLPTNPKASR